MLLILASPHVFSEPSGAGARPVHPIRLRPGLYRRPQARTSSSWRCAGSMLRRRSPASPVGTGGLRSTALTPSFLDPDSPDANDPSNPLAAFGIKAIDLGGKHSSQIFRTLVPGARVVKAFNHLAVSVLPDPAVSGGQRVLFYWGDDADAKAEVRRLLEQTGHFPVDLGVLDVGGPLTSPPHGALAGINFIKI